MALKPKVERASILFYVLGAVHCIPGVAAVCIGIHGLQSPPLSEARTWAYLPLVMAAVVLFPWAAIAFVAAYKLQKQAFSGWAIGITYCVVNAVLSCLGIVWIYMAPVYVGMIWYLARRRTRARYRRRKEDSGDDDGSSGSRCAPDSRATEEASTTLFSYAAITSSTGQIVTGTIAADTPNDARVSLEDQGLFPTHIQEADEGVT